MPRCSYHILDEHTSIDTWYALFFFHLFLFHFVFVFFRIPLTQLLIIKIKVNNIREMK
jgi:hypothetical protein